MIWGSILPKNSPVWKKNKVDHLSIRQNVIMRHQILSIVSAQWSVRPLNFPSVYPSVRVSARPSIPPVAVHKKWCLTKLTAILGLFSCHKYRKIASIVCGVRKSGDKWKHHTNPHLLHVLIGGDDEGALVEEKTKRLICVTAVQLVVLGVLLYQIQKVRVRHMNASNCEMEEMHYGLK